MTMEYRLLQKIKSEIDSLYSHDLTHYHTIRHAEIVHSMINVYWTNFQLECKDQTDLDHSRMILEIAGLFHDCVYVPGSESNEIDSADQADAFLKNENFDSKTRKEISDLILSTKIGSKLDTPEKRFLHDLDWSGFATYEQLIEDEQKIFNEFRDGGYLLREVYSGRFDFYRSIEIRTLERELLNSIFHYEKKV